MGSCRACSQELNAVGTTSFGGRSRRVWPPKVASPPPPLFTTTAHVSGQVEQLEHLGFVEGVETSLFPPTSASVVAGTVAINSGHLLHRVATVNRQMRCRDATETGR